MPQKPADVSIIIVNWNTRQLLMECIASLKAETRDAVIEYIVVDNGSKDGSQAALKEKHRDVILIENNANLGFAKANNIGFSKATGRYICLVNSDIVALNGVVDKMLKYMDAHPRVGVLGPKTVNENYKIRMNCRDLPSLRNTCCDYLFFNKLFPGLHSCRGRALSASTYSQTHPAEVISGCFMMVRRVALEQVGMLDERFFFYGEDTDWCKRFLAAGWGIVFYHEASAIHYGGGSTTAEPVRYCIEKEKADLQYWIKHHGKPACACYLAIKTVNHILYGTGWGLVHLLKRRHSEFAHLKTMGHIACLVWLVSKRSVR